MFFNRSGAIAMLFRVKKGVNVPISCHRHNNRIIRSDLRILDDPKPPAMVNVRSSVNQVMNHRHIA
jgi:hypothetical protein